MEQLNDELLDLIKKYLVSLSADFYAPDVRLNYVTEKSKWWLIYEHLGDGVAERAQNNTFEDI